MGRPRMFRIVDFNMESNELREKNFDLDMCWTLWNLVSSLVPVEWGGQGGEKDVYFQIQLKMVILQNLKPLRSNRVGKPWNQYHEVRHVSRPYLIFLWSPNSVSKVTFLDVCGLHMRLKPSCGGFWSPVCFEVLANEIAKIQCQFGVYGIWLWISRHVDLLLIH